MHHLPPEYSEYREYIAVPEVRKAFDRLVAGVQTDGRYELRKAPHGYMQNLTFIDGDKRPYSVVPAKKWITVYLRNPRSTHPGLTLDALRSRFEGAAPAQGHELKVILRTEDEAIEILELIGVPTGSEFRLPEEVPPQADELTEGAVQKVLINAYERNRQARAICIKHYGLQCSVCDLSFEDVYGDIGRGYIHVHHVVSLASVGRSYVVDPIRDLRPVCANCHSMLHTSEPPLSIDELRRRLTPRSTGSATAGSVRPG
jgi:hypothetical protein